MYNDNDIKWKSSFFSLLHNKYNAARSSSYKVILIICLWFIQALSFFERSEYLKHIWNNFFCAHTFFLLLHVIQHLIFIAWISPILHHFKLSSLPWSKSKIIVTTKVTISISDTHLSTSWNFIIYNQDNHHNQNHHHHLQNHHHHQQKYHQSYVPNIRQTVGSLRSATARDRSLDSSPLTRWWWWWWW